MLTQSFFVIELNTLYPFWFGEYPTKMYFSALGSSLDRDMEDVCIKAVQPNTFKRISVCNRHAGKIVLKLSKGVQ